MMEKITIFHPITEESKDMSEKWEEIVVLNNTHFIPLWRKKSEQGLC